MTIKINAHGNERQRLANTISKWLWCPATYHGCPAFTYEVGDFIVERNGSLSFDDGIDRDILKRLLAHLKEEGFDMELSAENFSNPEVPETSEAPEAVEEPETYEEPEAPAEEEISGICISMPRSRFTDANLEILQSIITAKKGLICKALGTNDLPLEITDEKVSFPWFPGNPDADSIKAYDTFICKLCDMACNQKRSTAKEKPVDNEKYAFRCFLLRLGFIGEEYKPHRKILLQNMTGSSAFKSGAKHA